MSNKEKLRHSFANTRLYLSQKYQDESSKMIERKIIHYIERYNLKRFGIFVSTKNEPSTINIINFALKNDIEVFAPAIVGQELEFRKINNLEIDLQNNKDYNFLQPKNDCEKLSDPNYFQNIFVPLIAFDKHLNRLGYGKGYYDRWFNKNHFKGTKIGICQSSQLSNQNIDVDDHDVPMNLIITEKEIFVPLEKQQEELENDITYAVFNDETIVN